MEKSSEEYTKDVAKHLSGVSLDDVAAGVSLLTNTFRLSKMVSDEAKEKENERKQEVEQTIETINELSTKPLPDTYRTINQPVIKKNVFTLPSPIGFFLGEMQRHKLAIAFDGDPGAGKTTTATHIMNAFFDYGIDQILFHSLEMGGWGQKDLDEAMMNIDEKHRSKVVVNDEDSDMTFERLAADGKKFPVVVIDSWGKTGLHVKYFDRLRHASPDTIWIVIFQRTTAGTARGGTSSGYDAGIVIKGHAPIKDSFEHNYLTFSKNRGNSEKRKLVYNVAQKKTFDKTEYESMLREMGVKIK